ncbi:MAG: VF530 family protein [Bdellovibrionota bacterium]
MNKVQENLAANKPALDSINLETMVTELVASYGWERLAEKISINSFSENPSIKSSLKFLRKTDWARTKVEQLYIWRAKTGWDPRDNAK